MALLFTSRVFRLSRAQFLPVVVSPVMVGSALAWSTERMFSLSIFALAVLGVILLHLAANTIDDAYDFESGVDVLANEMFPPDFGGWKVLPRGLMKLSQAKQMAHLFFALATIIGLYLTYLAGPLVLVLGVIGVFFAYFHVAPPLKLGYRGLGLSEAGIFVSFGVLPVIGSFFVQTERVSWNAIILGVPIGLLTASILINHDQIFFDAYQKYTALLGPPCTVRSACMSPSRPKLCTLTRPATGSLKMPVVTSLALHNMLRVSCVNGDYSPNHWRSLISEAKLI